jgi:FemAB-related protein (PEP-CTERM system-associated)
VKVVEYGDAAEAAEAWDAFAEVRPEATFCHLHAWRAILAEGLRHRLRLLAVEDGGGLRGIMPLASIRGPLGSYVVSTPFLNYGGPVGDPDAVRTLVAHAVEVGREERVDLVELRCRRRVWAREVDGGDAGPPAGTRVSDRRVTVVLDLPDDTRTLWEGLRSKVRSQVRRPMKEDMDPRFGAHLLDDFYAVFARNMRDLGTPVLPRRFFHAIVDRLPDVARVGVVFHGGAPVAAGFGFLWRGEFEMTWASSLREFNRLAPNMLLYWAFMRHARESGAGRFNFGRCPPGGGTHRFKRQWGGEDEPLPWLHWSAEAARGTPSPSSGKFALATGLWRRLPVALTIRLGPLIARTIP